MAGLREAYVYFLSLLTDITCMNGTVFLLCFFSTLVNGGTVSKLNDLLFHCPLTKSKIRDTKSIQKLNFFYAKGQKTSHRFLQSLSLVSYRFCLP